MGFWSKLLLGEESDKNSSSNQQGYQTEYQPDMCDGGYCQYYMPYLSEKSCSMCNFRSDNSDGSYTCQKDYKIFHDLNARCRLGGCRRQNYEPVKPRTSPAHNNCPLPPKR